MKRVLVSVSKETVYNHLCRSLRFWKKGRGEGRDIQVLNPPISSYEPLAWYPEDTTGGTLQHGLLWPWVASMADILGAEVVKAWVCGMRLLLWRSVGHDRGGVSVTHDGEALWTEAAALTGTRETVRRLCEAVGI